MSKILGIDLGTTNSAISIYENGTYKIIPNKEGRNTTPSIVAFTDKNEVLVGETAKRQSVTNPENTIYSIKRIMGLMSNEENGKKAKDKVSYKIVDKNGMLAVQIKDKVYTPQEISAKILMKLKKDAEDFLGYKVNETVITVPAYFNDAQRKATKEAGLIAGLEVKRIINEPTAAALAYGLDKKEDEKVLIFDLGGGTFDVSVLDIGDGAFEVMASSGNAFLGGDDIDNIITKYILNEFKNNESIDLSIDKMAMQRINESAESLKKELSSSNESDINLPFITANASGPKHLNIKFTRSKFEGLIESIVVETIPYLDEVLKDSGISKSEINEIIMVGGSTRIPLVQEKIKSYFGKELNFSVNPDEVVAAGAAIQGGVLSNDVKDVLLLDVTPLSLGIETLGNVVTKLIEKGTTIPCSKTETFSTAQDNQPAVTINVLQGEREFAKDNKSLGQFNLEGIPPAPKGTPQIEVKFDIDANGILKVSALEKNTGKQQEITISNSSGLSEEEINNMIKEAELNKEADKTKAEIIKKRNELDSLVSNIQKQCTDNNFNLEDIPGLKDVVSEAESLVKDESQDISKINDVINRLNTLVQSMYQTMQNQQSGGYNAQSGCGTQQTKKQDDDIIDAEVA